MRTSLAFLAVFLSAGLVAVGAEVTPLAPGKPADIRKARSNRDVVMGVGLVGAAGILVAGVLIFGPSDSPPQTSTGTSP